MTPDLDISPSLDKGGLIILARSNITPQRHSTVIRMWVCVSKCKADDLATLTIVLTSTFNGKLVIYEIGIWVPSF